MILKFTKMHGLGNDFVVIDNLSEILELTSEQIRYLADRHFGIGFDQLLVIKPATTIEADFYYQIFNADGSEAEQCGNGVRCVARYVIEKKHTHKKTLTMQAKAGLMKVVVTDFDTITVNMGQPILQPSDIPFQAQKQAKHYVLHLFEQEKIIMVISMGNPHAILQVDDVEQARVHALGRQISSHSDFPKGANVEFMEIQSSDTIKLRVFERGVGETLACGSGACAAVAAGILNNLLTETVDVVLKGGKLKVNWQGPGYPVLMTGAACRVFEGSVEIEHL